MRFRLLAATAITLPLCACGTKSDEFSKVTRCLREHKADNVTTADYTKLARPRWKIGRYVLGADKIILIGTPNESEARITLRKAASATNTLGGPRLVMHRDATLVYWWERTPSRSHTRIVEDCIA